MALQAKMRVGVEQEFRGKIRMQRWMKEKSDKRGAAEYFAEMKRLRLIETGKRGGCRTRGKSRRCSRIAKATTGS